MGDYIVEGVSQEAFIAAGFTLGVAFPLLLLVTAYFGRRRMASSQRIHPSLRLNVETTRHRVPRRDAQLNANEQDQCPICIDLLQFSTETNCGHIFCAPCILAYWSHGSWLHCMKCPICRQEVTIIFCNFSEEEASTDQAHELSAQISTYNRRFSGESRTVGELSPIKDNLDKTFEARDSDDRCF